LHIPSYGYRARDLSVSLRPTLVKKWGITLIESVIILAKGLGAGRLVDTSAGVVVVVVLLYLRPARLIEVVALDLLSEQHNRTVVRVAMLIVLRSQ